MVRNRNDPSLNDDMNGQVANPPVRRVILGINCNLNGQGIDPQVPLMIDDCDRLIRDHVVPILDDLNPGIVRPQI